MLCCVSKRAVDGDHGPPYENRARADRLPVLLEKIEVEFYPEEDVPPILLPCATCARTFMPQSLEKHKKICEKAAAKKRKPFDSAKQRIQGTELADFLPKQERRRQEDVKPNNKSAWKQTHDEFLRAIRAARGEVVDTPTRQSSSQITSGAPTRANEKGTCPTCNRHFGIKAYDRHVAWCKERSTRLPVSPATNLAKERFEARMKYRAPGLKNRRPTNREKYSPGSSIALNVSNHSQGNNNKLPSPSQQQVKAKESVSLPSCNKGNDSVVKQRPVVANRRFAQSREPLNSSGPMKSRVADRINRQAKNCAPVTPKTPPTSRTSQLVSPVRGTVHSPVNVVKSKRGSAVPEFLKTSARGVATSPKMKTRQRDELKMRSMQNGVNGIRAKDGNRWQAMILARSQKMNIVSARSQGYPKINDVAVNKELTSVTVQPCVIYKEEEFVTWRQISRHEDASQVFDRESDSSSDRLKDFQLPDMEEHQEDEVSAGIQSNVTLDQKQWPERQHFGREIRQRMEFAADERKEKDYDLKKEEKGKLSSEECDRKKLDTLKDRETCALSKQEGDETKDATFRDAEEIETVCDDKDKMSKWSHVTQGLNETYLISDSTAEESAIIKDLTFSTAKKWKSLTLGPRVEFCLEEPVKCGSEINFQLNLRTITDVDSNDNLDDSLMISKADSVRDERNLDSNDLEGEMEMFCSISGADENRSTTAEYVNENKDALHAKTCALLDCFELDENFIVNEINFDNDADIQDFTLISTEIKCNEPFEIVSASPIRSSTPFEVVLKHNNCSQSNSDRSDRSTVHGEGEPIFPSNSEQTSNAELTLSFFQNDERSGSNSSDVLTRNARSSCKLSELTVEPRNSFTFVAMETETLAPKVDDEYSRTTQRNTRHANPSPTKLPDIAKDTIDRKMFVKICGAHILGQEPDRSATHFTSDDSADNTSVQKRQRTYDSPNCEISAQENNLLDESNKIRESSPNIPNSRATGQGRTFESANNMDVAKDDDDQEICEKYVNENFDYESDATVGEQTSCQLKNVVGNELVTPVGPSLKRTAMPKISRKQTLSDTRVKLNKRSLGKIVEHESSRDENRLPLDEMQRKIRRTMHLLQDSTDTLISSMEAMNAANYKHANVVNVVEVETIEEIDRKTKSVGFRTLPEIRNESKESRDRFAEEKSKKAAMTCWERMSNAKKNRFIDLDPPQCAKCRLPKRNPKIRFLPPVVSNSIMARRRNFTLPSRPVWSNYVRRRPDFNLVLRGRIGSKDYDPFMLAEQQMSELLSDTSDQSDLTSSTHTNKGDPFPLSHSSAFVKYPFEFANNKRSSLIAPPTEFEDLTSDFSSDSTETNSLSREIFLGDLRDSTESNFSEKKSSPTRELGRRVIIDKSRALGSDVVDGPVGRDKKSFIGSGERARKILDKVTPKVPTKVVRPIANRSHSLRASSAPKSTPDRKSNNSGSTLSGSRRTVNHQSCRSDQSSQKCSDRVGDARNNSYAALSGSNLSLNSIISSSEVDGKRSNSVFDELMTSFEDDRTSLFPSLKSFLKDDSLPVPSSPPNLDGPHRNGNNSDEELSSPDSYRRQEHGKLSADSAYSSLNRKYSQHGRSTNDVGRFEEDGLRSSNRRATIEGETRCKMSKFCHECGMKFPETAKFCCECGVKRLAL